MKKGNSHIKEKISYKLAQCGVYGLNLLPFGIGSLGILMILRVLAEETKAVDLTSLDDLKAIEQNTNGFYTNESGQLFIKLMDGNYFKVYSSFNVYAKDKESLVFTNNEYIEDVEFLGTLQDYIIENDIEPIEYKMVDSSTLDEEYAKEYVIDTFGQETYDKLEEVGYPIPCFSINELNDAYLKQNDGCLILELK